jgi:hypothetical protein
MRFPYFRLWPVVAVCMLSPLFCYAQEAAASGEVSYLSFQVPGALGTYPMSINSSMTVTGYYYVSATVTGGFLRDADGTITIFSIRDGVWTEPESINDAGDITGFYEVVAGTPHGFVRYADGRILTADPAGGYGGTQAQPVSINDFGEIVGNHPYPLTASAGFTWSREGVFTTIEHSDGASYPTVLTGLNASGTVVGYCSDCFPMNVGNSFILHPDGFFTEFAVPLNEAFSSETTIAESINADGVIAGWYGVCIDNCVDKESGGFVRSPQGIFTLFTPPGTLVVPPGTDLFNPGNTGQSLSAPRTLSINDQGSITGSYTDAAGAQHGFVRNPYGTITPFDPPRGRQTTATGMNDGGVIAGWYFYDWNAGIAQGFLRMPKP